MGEVSVSRRTVLGAVVAGAAVAGAGGCGGAEWYPADVTPDEHVVRTLLREKELVAARYAKAVETGSGPADLLERLRGHHLEHVDALAAALPEESAAAQGPGEPSERPVDPAPDTAPDAEGLRVLEVSAAAARIDQAAAVSDPGLAQLISGIGACEAVHAHLLARA